MLIVQMDWKAVEADIVPAALTLFTAISCESRGTAAVSRDVVAGRALSAAAALHATLPIHARQTRWRETIIRDVCSYNLGGNVILYIIFYPDHHSFLQMLISM